MPPKRNAPRWLMPVTSFVLGTAVVVCIGLWFVGVREEPVVALRGSDWLEVIEVTPAALPSPSSSVGSSGGLAIEGYEHRMGAPVVTAASPALDLVERVLACEDSHDLQLQGAELVSLVEGVLERMSASPGAQDCARRFVLEHLDSALLVALSATDLARLLHLLDGKIDHAYACFAPLPNRDLSLLLLKALTVWRPRQELLEQALDHIISGMPGREGVTHVLQWCESRGGSAAMNVLSRHISMEHVQVLSEFVLTTPNLAGLTTSTSLLVMLSAQSRPEELQQIREVAGKLRVTAEAEFWALGAHDKGDMGWRRFRETLLLSSSVGEETDLIAGLEPLQQHETGFVRAQTLWVVARLAQAADPGTKGKCLEFFERALSDADPAVVFEAIDWMGKVSPDWRTALEPIASAHPHAGVRDRARKRLESSEE